MPGKPFPVCCQKPTISCERLAGLFHYEITGAVSAWITETCFDENGDPVVTQHQLTLDSSGAASGDFTTTDNCDYCVYAENSSGLVSCCDACEVDPVCSISAALAPSDCGTDMVVINWSYDAQGGPAIDEALINGLVSVLGNPDADSGTLTTSLGSLGISVTTSGAYTFELKVKSLCGQSTSVASLFLNCMDTKSQLRASVDIDDMDFACEYNLPTTDPEYREYIFGGSSDFVVEHYQVHNTTSGMSALNGTYFFERDPANFCLAETDRHIGSVTIDESYTAVCIQSPYVYQGELYWNVITYNGDHSATYDAYLGRFGLKFVRASFTPLAHTAVYRTYRRTYIPGETPYPWDYHGLPLDSEFESEPSGAFSFHMGNGQPQLIFSFGPVAECKAPGSFEVQWQHRTFPVTNVNFGCPADVARCNESNCKVLPFYALLGTVQSEWI